MKPEIAEVFEGLRSFAEQAVSRLEQCASEAHEDLQSLSDGLRDAYDTGHLLREVADNGVSVPVDLILAVERLVRATLETQPALVKRALGVTQKEGAPVDPPETTEWVNALRARSDHASMELHRGLAGLYRNAAELEVER